MTTFITPKPNHFFDAYRSALSMKDALTRLGFSVNGSDFIPCPNHTEKTPSCRIYDDHLYCYGCGYHSDLIGLVRHQIGGDFWGALSWVASEAGLPPPQRDSEAQRRHEAIQSISEIYGTLWTHSQKNPELALVYLENRGIPRTVSLETVGYLAPDYRPSDREVAEQAGLYSRKGNFLFSGRLIIPIYRHGQIVSLYGRALDEDKVPKHVYPAAIDPPMPTTLWGLDNTSSDRELYLCEGIIDALTLQTHGFQAAACYGTQGLTDDRVDELKRRGIRKLSLVFDNDDNAAGQTGALKAGERLFRAGFRVSVVSLPSEGDTRKVDPNSYFLTHSAGNFRTLSVQSFFNRFLKNLRHDESIESKYQALTSAVSLAASQPELTWKEHAGRIKARFPSFDQRKIEREISLHKKNSKDHRQEDKKFLPLSFVEKIRAESPVITFDGRVYRYNSGVYSLWHPEEIDKKTVELYGPEAQPNHLDAVRKFLMSECFIRPENVNLPGRLNLKNGILNLQADAFTEHTPDFLSTVQSDVRFDPRVECPLWLRTVEEILPDPDSRALLAQIFGYILTPDISQQKGFILFGQGSNGKSLVVEVLEALVGKGNCSALHLSDINERFRVAELQGKLVNITHEVESQGLVNDARLKSIISGDTILAERKNQAPFTFRPGCRWIILCNALPATSDRSEAWTRRLIVVPFDQTFSDPAKRDLLRAQKIIKTELSGVLNWAIGGYRSLKSTGRFIEPEACRKAHDSYQRQLDHTIDFIDECLRITDEASRGTGLMEIYKRYQEWAISSGFKPLGRNNFYQALERHTKRSIIRDGKNGSYIRGVLAL